MEIEEVKASRLPFYWLVPQASAVLSTACGFKVAEAEVFSMDLGWAWALPAVSISAGSMVCHTVSTLLTEDIFLLQLPFFLPVLGINPRILCKLGKCSVVQLTASAALLGSLKGDRMLVEF